MQAKGIVRLAVTAAFWLSTIGPGIPDASAMPISADYNVGFITTPGPAAGDVLEIGGVVFAGSGSFGAQSIVRIDGAGTTVIADGFTAIAGITYDAINDRLIVGDNGTGALTGDTIYGIVNPFGTPSTPATASGLELLPVGSTPGVADIILDPNDPTGNTLFLSDASESFPPLGEIVQIAISTQTITTLQTGLGFSAGLGTDGSTLFFGDVSVLDFSGNLSSAPLATPAAAAAFIGNYPTGMFDIEVESDGSILITSGGSILRVDPITGLATEIASGFGFAAGLFVGDDDTIYAIDGFAASGEENRIWVFTPVPEPGTGLLVGAGVIGLAWRRTRQSGSRNVNRTGTVTRP